jgi:hypothetical protein
MRADLGRFSCEDILVKTNDSWWESLKLSEVDEERSGLDGLLSSDP